MFSGGERILLVTIVLIYFLFLFLFSLYMNRKTKTYEDYNIAGRCVSLFHLILTFIGTRVGGSTLLGYMENGYKFGMGQQWINITMFMAVIILASFLLKRIRNLGDKHNMITVGDYTSLRYGEKARIPTVISFLFAYCAMTGMQFVAIATILNLTIGLNLKLGIFIGWALLTLKTYFGGLKTAIWHDVVNGTILTLGMILLFIKVLVFAGGWNTMSETTSSINQGNMMKGSNIDLSMVVGYLITLSANQLNRQDHSQRIWAAKNLKTAMNVYWISMANAILIGTFAVAIGVFCRYALDLGNIDPV